MKLANKSIGLYYNNDIFNRIIIHREIKDTIQYYREINYLGFGFDLIRYEK